MYVITLTPERKKTARRIISREQLNRLCNSAENVANTERARQQDISAEERNEAKRKLLQIACNLGAGAEGLLAGCRSQGSYFSTDVDCPPEDSERLKQLILSKKDEIGLMMLARSVNYGWHLVCRREQGTTILENQVRVASILRVEMDTNAKDLQRVLFTTTASDDDMPFLDDQIFTEPMTTEECIAEYERLKEREQRGEELVPQGAKKAKKHYRPWEDMENEELEGEQSSCQLVNLSTCQPEQSTCQLKYKDIPYALIINKWWERTGGVPVEGERNVRLYQLATNLRAICDNDREKLMQVMPRYGLSEQEVRSIIDSACKEPIKGLTKLMREIIAECLSGEQNTSQTPPPMPEKLPRLIQLLTSKTPTQYKAAVAHAVFPPLGAHLCNVWFAYTDNVLHEATLMNCLMAGTGAGKGCIDEPIRHIMADIKQRDEENLKREAEWKKECQCKGANKDKKPRPEGLIIQIIDPDMTKPALVTRMNDAEGHFVYTHLNELDLFDQLKGSTGKQHFQLMCLAFDPGAEYGQTRIGTSSVTARPKCKFNWNACTTIMKGRRYFRSVLTDGPISRINFCTIPEMEIGSPQPIYGQYDEKFDSMLKQYIDNLMAANGEIKCQQARKLAKTMQDRCAEFARLSQNETYWNLSHRACVIAWLKACVLYVANGQKWEKTIEEFAIWSLEYDLWCKMQFYGQDIEAANNGADAQLTHRGPRNLLEMLPETFSMDDAMSVRRRQGLQSDEKKCRNMITQWMYRGYVLQITDYSFKKTYNKNYNTKNQ